MILVRDMLESERAMVLSNWKTQLRDDRQHRGWGKDLRDKEFWLLANYVVDRISLPSSRIFIGTHPKTPEVPMCWMAVRPLLDPLGVESAGVNPADVLFLYCRLRVRDKVEVAAALERGLREEVLKHYTSLTDVRYNPYRELQR